MKIPRERYEELAKDKPRPYCFEIKKRKQVLFYFGANHSHDPKDPQYPILRKYWKKFVSAQAGSKVVVVEGYLRKVQKTARDAIRIGAEGDFVTRLAHAVKISLICPEPSFETIEKNLKKFFSNDEIRYYDFATMVDGWRRHNPRPDFTPWAKHRMLGLSKHYGYQDFTLSHMKAVHKKIFGKTFSLKNDAFFNHVTNPNRSDSVINQVSRTATDIREIAIIKKLQKEWRDEKSLFVVYGSGHAIIQEEILRRTLK